MCECGLHGSVTDWTVEKHDCYSCCSFPAFMQEKKHKVEKIKQFFVLTLIASKCAVHTATTAVTISTQYHC